MVWKRVEEDKVRVEGGVDNVVVQGLGRGFGF